VKVAVVTSPDSQDGNPSLQGDVRLVKAALLYADEVELLGLSANMVHAIGLAPGSRSLSLSGLIDLVDATGSPAITPEIRSLLPVFEAVDRGGLVLPAELQEGADQVAEFVAHANELLGPAQTDILNSTGAEELRPALASGLLSVADLGVGMKDAVAAAAGTGTSSDRAVQQWIDEISVRLRDGRTRLLFDEGSGDLVQSMFEEGVIAPNEIGLRLAGSAALGAGFVARLPAFTEAPMDELLDLRGELDAPLTRYRGAVAKFSATIPRMVGRHLDYEVGHLWEQEVAPALEEIDALLHEHTYVRELARHALQDVGKYLIEGATVFVGLGAASDVGAVAAGLAGTVPGVAEVSARALLGQRAGTASARRHDMFYLYKVNKRHSPAV
jgi:hypothetical protein